MKQAFVSDFDINNLTKMFSEGENRFLAENNKKQLEKLFTFYSGETKLMLVNGFVGSGKSQVVNLSKDFLAENVITLEYNCFETTILDDILLVFFKEFHELVAKGMIKQVKNKTDNFMQKIVSYFSEIDTPILIVLNSFENILNPNRKEIFDFLFHILKKDNVKLMIISRKLNFEDYIENVKYDKTTVLAFDKPLFEKYLRSEGIKNIGPVSDELYKFTKGYFLYTRLSVIIMKARNLTLIDFLSGYTKSFLPFADFIFREILSFVDPISGHLFRLLTLLRHPVGINLLREMGLYDEERVKFFVANFLLSKEKNTLYLQDYYKEISQNSIPDNVSVKLHRACVELYTSQLPLKPFERDLMISRQTMRSEIDFHNSFLPQKPKPMKELPMQTIEAERVQLPKSSEEPLKTPTREEILQNVSFVFHTDAEEQKIMDEIANSINGFIDYSNKVLASDESKLPFMELINRANIEEKRFNYQKAIAFYQSALTMKQDLNFPQMVSRIYTQTAKCFEHLSDWYNATKYYETAMAYYLNAHDYEKYNDIKLSLANIFFITYKHDKSKILLEEIVNEGGNISANLKAQAMINLADLDSHSANEKLELYNKALKLAQSVSDNSVLAKLYFKTASFYDETDSPENAIIFYKKCSDIHSDNKYLASALLGIAEILEETGINDKAVQYYKEGLRIEERDGNTNGQYLTLAKLANILKHMDTEEANKYYLETINVAKGLNTPYCVMISNIKYGDFCYAQKQYQTAISCYNEALIIAKENSKCEKYLSKIEQRIANTKKYST